jgi:protein-tyrosine kinase
VTDEFRRLDLIQRYAERLGQGEVNVADLLLPGHPDAALRAGAPANGPDVASTVSVSPPQWVKLGAARPHQSASSHDARDRGDRIQIDLGRLERLGFILPGGEKKTQIGEQFQTIKRPLIQKSFATGADAVHNGNSVMVTSAKPGEGKSFVALNLAMSIASERDLFVMLLDTDLYNQTLPSMLGVKVERGLVDVLLDESLDIADVLVRTNIPNFSLLPAGPRHPHSTELLSSQRMGRLMREIMSRYSDRIIVVDSPPVLASTEAGVLASLVGQIIMVVEQNRTGWRLVEQSLERLRDCSDISFVLNKVQPLWDDNFGQSYR